MPFQTKKFPYALSVGVDLKSVSDLPDMLEQLPLSFDFAQIDVCNMANFRDEKTIATRDIALTRSGKFNEPSLLIS